MSASYNQLSDALQMAGCGQLTVIQSVLQWRAPMECQEPIKSMLCWTGTENAVL